MATETTKLTYIEGAAASTPASGRSVVYAKSDGLMYSKDDAGAETLMSSGTAGAPTTADYLVGTANGSLSAEIVVGTSPGGELGGTWASPTVDATHSGSPHNLILISDTVLGSATANFDLTSIAGTYKHLLIEVQLRSDRAGNNGDAIKILLNNDTGGNYDFSNAQFDNTQWYFGSGAAAAAMQLWEATAATATAGAAASGFIEIANYAGTTWHKVVTARAFTPLGTGVTDIRSWVSGGRWRSTAAVTRVTIAPVNGSNFVTGSRCTLYGIA